MNYSSHSQYKRSNVNVNFDSLGRPNIEQVDVSDLKDTSKYKKTEASVNTSYAAAVLQQVDTTNKPQPINEDKPKISDYEKNSINSMTSGELMLYVFDLLIKRLGKAKMALKLGNTKFDQYKERVANKNMEIAINKQRYNDKQNECFAQFDEYIDSAEQALTHLKLSLDRTIPISKNLEQLYEYFSYVLVRAKFGRNAELIEYVKVELQGLKDSFAVAAGNTTTTPKTLEASDASKAVANARNIENEIPREPEDMEGRRMY